MKYIARRLVALILEAMLALGILGWAATAARAKPAEYNTAQHSRERVLNIHKEIPDGGKGEADGSAEYAVYRVAQLREVLFGQVRISRIPTARELAQYQTRDNLIASVQTDAAGLASCHLGYADGVYLVVEEGSGAPAQRCQPFYVCVPAPDPSGEGWLYCVDVSPRNGPMVGPEVDLDVTEVGVDAGVFDTGAAITYIIRGGVPGDLYRAEADGSESYAQSYRLTNVLDTRLDYLGNAQVRLFTRAGEEIPLTAGTHYALAEIPAAQDRGARLAVSLTEEGMRFLTEHLGSGEAAPEVRVFYMAAINASAAAGERIPANAGITYTDAFAYEYEPGRVSEENRPRVYAAGGA